MQQAVIQCKSLLHLTSLMLYTLERQSTISIRLVSDDWIYIFRMNCPFKVNCLREAHVHWQRTAQSSSDRWCSTSPGQNIQNHFCFLISQWISRLHRTQNAKAERVWGPPVVIKTTDRMQLQTRHKHIETESEERGTSACV